MPDLKISALPSGVPALTDYLVKVDEISDITQKITRQQEVDFLISQTEPSRLFYVSQLGGTPYTTLTEAISAAASFILSKGGSATVLLSPETYTESSINLPNNINLIGLGGAGSSQFVCNQSNVVGFTRNNHSFISGVGFSTLDGTGTAFRDNSTTNTFAETPSILNCKFHDTAIPLQVSGGAGSFCQLYGCTITQSSNIIQTYCLQDNGTILYLTSCNFLTNGASSTDIGLQIGANCGTIVSNVNFSGIGSAIVIGNNSLVFFNGHVISACKTGILVPSGVTGAQVFVGGTSSFDSNTNDIVNSSPVGSNIVNYVPLMSNTSLIVGDVKYDTVDLSTNTIKCNYDVFYQNATISQNIFAGIGLKSSDFTSDNALIFGITSITGPRSVFLPPPVAGQLIIIRDQTQTANAVNFVDITPPSGITIDLGSSVKIIGSPWVIRLYTDGSNYYTW